MSKYNSDVFVTETRINSDGAHKIIKKISLPNFIESTPIGFSGGIWLIWKDSIDFSNLNN